MRRIAQIAHQLGQRNTHRAHSLAFAAKTGSKWQRLRLVQAGQIGCQHGSHRPHIGGAIRMTARRHIDRAIIHAGPTTDTTQYIALIATQNIASPIVQQHNMKLFRAIGDTAAFWPGGGGNTAPACQRSARGLLELHAQAALGVAAHALLSRAMGFWGHALP